jgi:FtsZ-binding cell division protein ZapB
MEPKKDKSQEKDSSVKRDLLKEIEEIKVRRGDQYNYLTHPLVNNWQAAIYRIGDLQKSFEWAVQEHNYDGELLKYIPVGLVATLEAFFRGVISQFIDFGSPYAERATKFAKSENIRSDIDYLIALPQKRVSVGEFISHQIKINNLGNIVKYMTGLIEQDFWNSLKGVIDSESKELILKNPDDAYQNIMTMFEMRHIIAHEMNFYLRPQFSILEESLKNTLDIVNVTGELATTLMSIPVTLKEKLDHSRDKLQSLQLELHMLTEKFREQAKVRSDEDEFERENNAWQIFSSAHTSFAGWLRGGTGGVSVDGENGSDLAFREIEIEVIQARIKTLKHWTGT